MGVQRPLTGLKRSNSVMPFNTTRKVTQERVAQHKFNFDLVYGEKDTNRDVYEQTVRKVALASLQGINGTVFVYGQTGTGKTYTMMGHQRTQDDNHDHGATVKKQPIHDSNGQAISARTRHLYETYENSGVLIFAMQDLFSKINDIESASAQTSRPVRFQIKLSYIEIYNEVIYDLLVARKQEIAEKILTINETKAAGFKVNGANQVEVESIQQVLELIKVGELNRHYAETFLNHCSSRSHTMFRLHITSFTKKDNMTMQSSSYLNFVDLAGSEKITNYYGSKVAGDREISHNNRLKESLSINKSLFNLTQVIHLLSQKPNAHIPYRNSTLTKILRSSLGGNSRTSIIICITPADSQIEQTISSLKFGEKAMKVQQSAKVQMNELRNNALKNRNGYQSKGANDHLLREVVKEYEAKIKALEHQLANNPEVAALKNTVRELQSERDRLVHALELNCDRTFFTKQLALRQREGHTVMSLKYAGDIQIQSSALSSFNAEQILLERGHEKREQELIARQCKKTVDCVKKEAKDLKDENAGLKFECERLEKSYADIIDQFSKMQQIQSEIMQMSSRKHAESLDYDRLTDREIQRMDFEFKAKIARIKE